MFYVKKRAKDGLYIADTSDNTVEFASFDSILRNIQNGVSIQGVSLLANGSLNNVVISVSDLEALAQELQKLGNEGMEYIVHDAEFMLETKNWGTWLRYVSGGQECFLLSPSSVRQLEKLLGLFRNKFGYELQYSAYKGKIITFGYKGV